MSTRSVIGYKGENGIVTYTYCHFDGYPAGVGVMLLKYYNSEEAARQLASLHGFSCLRNTYEETKQEEYQDTDCPLYGEMPYKNWIEINCLFGADYIYTWENGSWTIRPQFGYDLETFIKRQYD